MDEQENQDFDLEDILREFGEEPAPEPKAPEVPETPETPEPAEALPEPEKEDFSDTGVIPEITRETIQLYTPGRRKSQSASDTVRVDPAESGGLSDTISIPPVDGATRKLPQDAVRMEQDEEVREYIPARPIPFRPKQQLREMKRKLVAGPEKRYYELNELGTGKLQVAIFLSLLVAFATAAITAMHAMGLISQERLRLVVFIQFFTMLVSAALGSFQLIEGVSDLFHGRFTLNTLLVFSFAACAVDGVFCFRELRVPCCAAFCLEMTMSLWGTYHKRVTETAQLDTMRKANRLGALFPVEDYYKGDMGLVRGEGDVDDFTENYTQTPEPEKVFSWYSLAALLVSLGAGVATYVLHGGISNGVRVTAAALLAAVPATAFITLTRPMAILQKRLHSLGVVLCGWQSIQRMSQRAVFALSHDDLFPTGTCKLNGVKYYGDREPDEVIAYSAALVSAVGGGLEPLFSHLLESHGGARYVAEDLRTYENGGVGGEVCGERVLVGCLPFLKDMGVEIPRGVRVSQAVYIAIDGELAGLVAVTYVKSRDASAGLSALCAYRGLYPAMTTGDFMLTEGFLHQKFGVNTRRILYPNAEERAALAEKKPDEEAQALALVTRDGLCGFACAVAGARSVRMASLIGTAIHLIGGILGLVMMVVLGVTGTFGLLTPSNMLLYQLVWMIPGLLVTEWTRVI